LLFLGSFALIEAQPLNRHMSVSLIRHPPAPAPPQPGATRGSYPWRGTAPWQWRAQRGPAPADQSRRTRCPDRGGNAPGAGACQFVCQGEGLLVRGCSLLGIRRIGMGIDRAKLVQREGLVPA